MPVVHMMLPGAIPASFGVGVGVTPNSDPVIFKANFYFGGAGSLSRDIRLSGARGALIRALSEDLRNV